ncbi:MAG: GAF domain-containing protein [Clostridia bacterium]|nr:GAF domain-containing protein [Deltaproteobacteria bacterium]
MQLFEVFIPCGDPDGIDITARLRAQSWTDALKQGLARLGDETDIKHVMCDIREDGIAVTEPKSGRVFRIREIPDEDAAAAASVHAASSARPTIPAPTPKASSAPPIAAPAPAVRRASLAGRGKESASRAIDDLLGDMFMAVGKIYELKNLNTAADFLLDLAMKAVAVESGRVIVASLNKNDLTFVAARGPKAELVKDIHLNVGQGIVGFAVQEGVAIAVSDAERDPRFYAGISQRIGSPTHSVACAPAQKDGRVYGALQLINKKDGATFTADDMSVLDYLASQFADYVINTGQTEAV